MPQSKKRRKKTEENCNKSDKRSTKDEGYTYTLEEALSEARREEIFEKDWKVVDLPPEDEIREKHGVHPNSMANLMQYNKRTREQKEKSAKNLIYGSTEKVKRDKAKIQEELAQVGLDFDAYYDKWESGGYDSKFLKSMIPTDILTPDEARIYFQLVDAFLNDFNPEEVTSNDIDSLLELVMARILQERLIKLSKGKGSLKHTLDVSKDFAVIGKRVSDIRKELSTRRSDRLKLRGSDDYSILDLVASADEANRMEKLERLRKTSADDEEYIKILEDRGYQV